MLNIHLIIHNIVSIFAILSGLMIGILVLIQNRKRNVNITFFFLNLSIVLFYITHLFGVNATNSQIANIFFTTHWINILMALFYSHFIFCFIGKDSEHKMALSFMYTISLLFIGFYIFNTELFVLPAISKMYFPYYYTAGPLYLYLRAYIILIPLYPLIFFLKSYIQSAGIERTKYNYILIATIFGFGLGTTTVLPFYNINFDPTISMTFGFYTLFLAYAIFKFNLLEIKIIAKRALVYSVSFISISILFSIINSLHMFINERYINVPTWIIPTVSSFGIVAMGAVVWSRMRESDILKYEFITVITHKFRTPLTAMKWSTELLKNSQDRDEQISAIKNIEEIGGKLDTLVETLIEVSNTENDNHQYKLSQENLSDIIKEVTSDLKNKIENKKIEVEIKMENNIPNIMLDRYKMKFAIHAILENSINYSPNSSKVEVILSENNNLVFCKIKDNGIGIPKDDLPYIFSKFYRSQNVESLDTEGLGIGLYIASNIIKHHGGNITADSEGVNKGSEFTISLRK